MRNRAIQVSLVKDKTATDAAPEAVPTVETNAAVIAATGTVLIGAVGRAVLGYVVLDTVRRVIVAKATQQ